MKRLLSVAAPAIALPAPDIEIGNWASPWARVLPLWRYAAWLGMLFAVCAISVSVRVDVQRLQTDLGRNAVLQSEAGILNERLLLEWDVRRRTEAMEILAGQMALSSEASMVRVGVVQ